MLKNQSLALLMIGVPDGDGDDSRTSSRCMEEVWKKFQMTNFDMPNNVSSIEYALNQSLALRMLGFPMGMGMAPELYPDVQRGSEKVSND